MRITSGTLGGRHFEVPSGIRPTQDKVRQALFSSLGERIADAHVLELFAGSGALGLEAWSRGAASVTWVEKDPRVFRVLQANVKTLCGADPALRVVCSDAVRYLERAAPAPAWDLVLADPPYDREARHDWLGNALRALDARPMLSPMGWVVFEQGADEEIQQPPGWRCLKDRKYGDTRLLTYARNSSERPEQHTSEPP